MRCATCWSCRRVRRAFAAMLTAGSVASTPACAQQVPPGVPTLAEVCRKSETEFRERRIPERYRRAVADLQSCPDFAAPLFAAEWHRPPVDSVDLAILSSSSGRVPRRELFDALEAVARSPGFSRAARLAALNAMVGQVLPDRTLNYTDISRIAPPGREPVAFGYFSSSPRSGRLNGGARRELLALFEELGRSDADEVVRQIGEFLAVHMRRELE